MYDNTRPETQHRFEDKTPQQTVTGAVVAAAAPPAVVAAMAAPVAAAVVFAAVVAAGVAVVAARDDRGDAPDETDPPTATGRDAMRGAHATPADD